MVLTRTGRGEGLVRSVRPVEVKVGPGTGQRGDDLETQGLVKIVAE